MADLESALGPADLERLAIAAFLIGREKEFERTLGRAHRAYRDTGDRPSAARCAFWIGLLLFLGGKSGAATGWLARGQRLLEQEGRETAEEGYLLLPVAEQHLRVGELERARAVAREAIGLGTRLGDRDLIVAARHVEGRTLIEMGQVEEGFALPGWALVGDAGYNKDFITAQGIQDAFRDAELCVRALDEAWSGRRSLEEAMAGYQSARDEHVLPMYEFTAELASLDPHPRSSRRFSRQRTGTRKRWTDSPASTRESPPRQSSSPRPTCNASSRPLDDSRPEPVPL